MSEIETSHVDLDIVQTSNETDLLLIMADQKEERIITINDMIIIKVWTLKV